MTQAESRSLAFPRKRRITQGRDFLRIKQSGKRVIRGCLIANWLELPAESESRLGVITSRKVGGAVIRNRARRLMREAFRQHQHDFDRPVDLVLIARRSIADLRYEGVEKDLLTILRQARLLKPTP